MTEINIMKARFNQTPALAICGIETNPLPKTIAFGGVATGNINAALAANVTGIANSSGF